MATMSNARPAARVHLVMVPNPPYHPSGDFALAGDRVLREAHPRLTFGNIGVYDTALFRELPRGVKLRMLPLYHAWIDAGIVTGERYDARRSRKRVEEGRRSVLLACATLHPRAVAQNRARGAASWQSKTTESILTCSKRRPCDAAALRSRGEGGTLLRPAGEGCRHALGGRRIRRPAPVPSPGP